MAAAFDRKLTDEERQLMCDLAVQVIVKQTNASVETASEVLADFAERGEVVLRGDSKGAVLEAPPGQVLVRVERDWLAFHANHPGEGPMKDGQWGRPKDH